jgi:glycosyl transferase, family 25
MRGMTTRDAGDRVTAAGPRSARTIPDIYVINLAGSDARLAAVTAQLDSAGLSFTRVAAIDGRGKPATVFPQYDAAATLRYNGRPMLGTEVACYLSHVAAATCLLATDAPYALVLEDDVVLSPTFATQLSDTVHWLDSQRHAPWHVINLGVNGVKYITPIARVGEHTVHHAHYFAMMASGMLWTRAGAAALVRSSRAIFAPVDTYLRHALTRNQRGLVLLPPVVQTLSNAASEIDDADMPRDRSSRRGALYFLRKQRRTLLGNMIAILGLLRARLTRSR